RFEDEAGTQSYFSERRSGDCGRVASPLDGRKGPSPLSPRTKCRPFTAKWFRDPGQGRTTASREILAQPHFQCALRYISWPSKVLTPFRPTLYNQDKLATPGRPVGRKFPVNRSTTSNSRQTGLRSRTVSSNATTNGCFQAVERRAATMQTQ